MCELLLTPQAIEDLEKIYDYTITTWNLRQAEKYQDELFEGMQRISNNPETGSIYYFKKGNYRKLLVNKHLIFYKIENNNCVVVRILHERMDLNAHLI